MQQEKSFIFLDIFETHYARISEGMRKSAICLSCDAYKKTKKQGHIVTFVISHNLRDFLDAAVIIPHKQLCFVCRRRVSESTDIHYNNTTDLTGVNT